jgi:hypothetical protein
METEQKTRKAKTTDYNKWAKIEVELKKEEELEKKDPNRDLMEWFQDLYCAGDEDAKRAMKKSMQESGSTVLSTNWKEVAEKNFKEKNKEKS